MTESMRILAGLQESKVVENLLPTIIKEEQLTILKETQRIKDEQKTVISHFDLFEQKMQHYQEMITTINTLLNEDNKKEFINGLMESKYYKLQKFADIVINENFGNVMHHLENNYYFIKDELDTIVSLTETINEESCISFFVSKDIDSRDTNHGLTFGLYENKDFTNKLSNKIKYGTQIFSVNEELSLIKCNGKKRFINLTYNHLKILENKGFLL